MPRGVYVRTKAIRNAIRKARLGTKASEATRAKIAKRIHKQALDPEWRKRVSEGTRKAMRTLSVRRKHLKGLRKAIAKHGPNFKYDVWEKELAVSLVPLGYVEQYYVTRGRGSGNRYILDFALVEAKIKAIT